MRASHASVLLVLLAGCSSLGRYELGRGGSSVAGDAPGLHVVRRGETLYKIASEHGIDQRDLVRWNGIRNPDRIYEGQVLSLVPPPGDVAPSTRSSASAAAPSVPRAESAARAAAPASRTRRSPAPPAVTPARTPASSTRARSVAPSPAPAWQWPTEGLVVSRFGEATGIATGIGIAGRAGQSVRAAAGGRVVYAGSGLIGYGQLVIIKHNDTYLTAYGYNAELNVRQGQDVRRGDVIATMGVGPGRQPRLHFEIRRDGVPIDPLPLLAARR